MEQKKLLKKTYSVVVAAVNEGWFISFVRTILKFGRRMKQGLIKGEKWKDV